MTETIVLNKRNPVTLKLNGSGLNLLEDPMIFEAIQNGDLLTLNPIDSFEEIGNNYYKINLKDVVYEGQGELVLSFDSGSLDFRISLPEIVVENPKIAGLNLGSVGVDKTSRFLITLPEEGIAAGTIKFDTTLNGGHDVFDGTLEAESVTGDKARIKLDSGTIMGDLFVQVKSDDSMVSVYNISTEEFRKAQYDHNSGNPKGYVLTSAELIESNDLMTWTDTGWPVTGSTIPNMHAADDIISVVGSNGNHPWWVRDELGTWVEPSPGMSLNLTHTLVVDRNNIIGISGGPSGGGTVYHYDLDTDTFTDTGINPNGYPNLSLVKFNSELWTSNMNRIYNTTNLSGQGGWGSVTKPAGSDSMSRNHLFSVELDDGTDALFTSEFSTTRSNLVYQRVGTGWVKVFDAGTDLSFKEGITSIPMGGGNTLIMIQGLVRYGNILDSSGNFLYDENNWMVMGNVVSTDIIAGPLLARKPDLYLLNFDPTEEHLTNLRFSIEASSASQGYVTQGPAIGVRGSYPKVNLQLTVDGQPFETAITHFHVRAELYNGTESHLWTASSIWWKRSGTTGSNYYLSYPKQVEEEDEFTNPVIYLHPNSGSPVQFDPIRIPVFVAESNSSAIRYLHENVMGLFGPGYNINEHSLAALGRKNSGTYQEVYGGVKAKDGDTKFTVNFEPLYKEGINPSVTVKNIKSGQAVPANAVEILPDSWELDGSSLFANVGDELVQVTKESTIYEGTAEGTYQEGILDAGMAYTVENYRRVPDYYYYMTVSNLYVAPIKYSRTLDTLEWKLVSLTPTNKNSDFVKISAANGAIVIIRNSGILFGVKNLDGNWSFTTLSIPHEVISAYPLSDTEFRIITDEGDCLNYSNTGTLLGNLNPTGNYADMSITAADITYQDNMGIRMAMAGYNNITSDYEMIYYTTQWWKASLPTITPMAALNIFRELKMVGGEYIMSFHQSETDPYIEELVTLFSGNSSSIWNIGDSDEYPQLKYIFSFGEDKNPSRILIGTLGGVLKYENSEPLLPFITAHPYDAYTIANKHFMGYNNVESGDSRLAATVLEYGKTYHQITDIRFQVEIPDYTALNLGQVRRGSTNYFTVDLLTDKDSPSNLVFESTINGGMYGGFTGSVKAVSVSGNTVTLEVIASEELGDLHVKVTSPKIWKEARGFDNYRFGTYYQDSMYTTAGNEIAPVVMVVTYDAVYETNSQTYSTWRDAGLPATVNISSIRDIMAVEAEAVSVVGSQLWWIKKIDWRSDPSGPYNEGVWEDITISGKLLGQTCVVSKDEIYATGLIGAAGSRADFYYYDGTSVITKTAPGTRLPKTGVQFINYYDNRIWAHVANTYSSPAHDHELFSSEDNGDTWVLESYPPGVTFFNGMHVAGSGYNQTLYAWSGFKVYQYNNPGWTEEILGGGSQINKVTSTQDEWGNDILYASTDYGGIYRKESGYANWELDHPNTSTLIGGNVAREHDSDTLIWRAGDPNPFSPISLRFNVVPDTEALLLDILGLAGQNNYELFDTSYDVNGKLIKSFVKIYEDNTWTSVRKTLEVDVTYDPVSGYMTSYTSKEM